MVTVSGNSNPTYPTNPTTINSGELTDKNPGAQLRPKSWGDQGFGPNTGTLAPCARPKAALGVGCGRGSPPPAIRGSPPPAVRVRDYHPRKSSENSDAKSCILVTTCCEISCFFLNYGQEVGGPIHCWSQPKSWGDQSPPVPYGCCAYDIIVYYTRFICVVCAQVNMTSDNKIHHSNDTEY